jgi:hypothetical protein
MVKIENTWNMKVIDWITYIFVVLGNKLNKTAQLMVSMIANI